MALSRFQREVNMVERFLAISAQDKSYAITMVVTGLAFNRHNCDYLMNRFRNGKKLNGYPLLDLVFQKYEQDERFEQTQANENMVVIQQKQAFILNKLNMDRIKRHELHLAGKRILRTKNDRCGYRIYEYTAQGGWKVFDHDAYKTKEACDLQISIVCKRPDGNFVADE